MTLRALGSVSRVLSIRVSTHPPGGRFGTTDLAAVTQLVADVEARIGFRPLSDQGWVDLVHGATTTTVAVQVTSGGDGALVGYAQATASPGDGANGTPDADAGSRTAWTVETVIADQAPASVADIAEALLDTTITAIGEIGGGELNWLVQAPTDTHEALAEAHGLEQGRRLLQMRRPLPTDISFEVATRPFDPEHDIADWVRVNARAFAWNPEQGSWTEENVRARLAESWFDPEGFLIHERSGPDGALRMAGFCWTKVHPATAASPALGEIYVIAVDPDFHGLGLGRALTLAGLDSLATRGITVGMLFVDADNTAAVTLYDKLGFTIHRTDCLYTGRVDGRVDSA